MYTPVSIELQTQDPAVTHLSVYGIAAALFWRERKEQNDKPFLLDESKKYR